MYAKAFPVILAKCAKVPVVLTSQGIGPFDHFLDRYIARLILRSASVIGCRDGEGSAAVARGLGAYPFRLVFTGDDSLLLQRTPDARVGEVLKKESIPNDVTLIGVNLRDSSSYHPGYLEQDAAALAWMLDQLIELIGCHVVFIPISYNEADDDRVSAQRIVNAMRFKSLATVISGEYDPTVIMGIVGAMQAAIGTSYHFNVFALSQGVPSVGVYRNGYYEQKLTSVFSLYGMDKYCLDTRKHSPQTVFETIERMIKDNADIRKRLRLRNKELVRLANKSHLLLGDIIAGAKDKSRGVKGVQCEQGKIS
jgi:polysaccharide pyruvyl transferase WcaK-like protein